MTPLFNVLVQLLATAAGILILARAVNVVRKMDPGERREHYVAWFMFGLSYTLLACAAAGAVLAVWSGEFAFGHLVWLGASSGLILFDRRRRPKPARDPEATVPLGAQ